MSSQTPLTKESGQTGNASNPQSSDGLQTGLKNRHLSMIAIGMLKTLGADNIAKTAGPERALPLLGITNNPDTYGT